MYTKEEILSTARVRINSFNVANTEDILSPNNPKWSNQDYVLYGFLVSVLDDLEKENNNNVPTTKKQ
jgi:hypothetical protein